MGKLEYLTMVHYVVELVGGVKVGLGHPQDKDGRVWHSNCLKNGRIPLVKAMTQRVALAQVFLTCPVQVIVLQSPIP